MICGIATFLPRPHLVQVERFGVVIDAVAVTTKSGHLFVFDRDTGKIAVRHRRSIGASQ